MHIKDDMHKNISVFFSIPLMIKMCVVVRRLLVTIILLETMIWTYTPLCTAYSSFRGFKCDCPTNDGDTIRQDPGNVWATPSYSTVNYHYGQIPIYYQLLNGQRLVPPPSNAINYHRQQAINPSYRGPSNAGSYRFIYEAENYRKEESADEDGNIRGYFEYEDYAGLHTLNYTCDDKSGFRITGGNLAPAFPAVLPPIRRKTDEKPVSSVTRNKPPTTRKPIKEPASDKLDFPVSEDSESAVSFSLSNLKLNLDNLTTQLNQLFKTFYNAPKDGNKGRPYYISINSGSLQMEESSYSNGDARGYIQFDDVDGHHNLSYFRNEVIGFLVTGGNLAIRSPTYLPPSDAARTNNRGLFNRNYTATPGRINVTVIRDSDDVTFVKGNTTTTPGE